MTPVMKLIEISIMKMSVTRAMISALLLATGNAPAQQADVAVSGVVASCAPSVTVEPYVVVAPPGATPRKSLRYVGVAGYHPAPVITIDNKACAGSVTVLFPSDYAVWQWDVFGVSLNEIGGQLAMGDAAGMPTTDTNHDKSKAIYTVNGGDEFTWYASLFPTTDGVQWTPGVSNKNIVMTLTYQ